MTTLSDRYAAAVAFAADVHRDQFRKGTATPYLAHLLSVSALVLEAGGDEDQAIAGLLHDTLEDHPDRTSYADVADRFGTRVADLVRACSDTEERPKPPWRERKTRYLADLESAEEAALLVVAADKLHNARAIVADHRAHGDGLWARFHAGPVDQLWFYDRACRVCGRRLTSAPALAAELHRVVVELHERLAGHHPEHGPE